MRVCVCVCVCVLLLFFYSPICLARCSHLRVKVVTQHTSLAREKKNHTSETSHASLSRLNLFIRRALRVIVVVSSCFPRTSVVIMVVVVRTENCCSIQSQALRTRRRRFCRRQRTTTTKINTERKRRVFYPREARRCVHCFYFSSRRRKRG